jgi:hypothetical protein
MGLTLATQANVNATAIVFKSVAHGLVTGALVSVPSTVTGQTAANSTGSRVIRVDADTFNLENPITGVDYVATGTGSAVGTLTIIATPAFGTAALVNADAAANGFAQTATVTANNYALVTINAGYTGQQLPTPEARVVPIRWWISEDGLSDGTLGTALLSTIATSYLA